MSILIRRYLGYSRLYTAISDSIFWRECLTNDRTNNISYIYAKNQTNLNFWTNIIIESNNHHLHRTLRRNLVFQMSEAFKKELNLGNLIANRIDHPLTPLCSPESTQVSVWKRVNGLCVPIKPTSLPYFTNLCSDIVWVEEKRLVFEQHVYESKNNTHYQLPVIILFNTPILRMLKLHTSSQLFIIFKIFNHEHFRSMLEISSLLCLKYKYHFINYSKWWV